MRIGDSYLPPYGQAPRPERQTAVRETATTDVTPQPPLSDTRIQNSSQVLPIGEGEKQQLLQNYLQQQAVSRDASAGYHQQRAVDAYSQQAQQGERAQLQEMLGIDEYV